MGHEYEINLLAKEESWRMFRIIGELVEGFDKLAGIQPAVTIYGSARLKREDPLFAQTEEIARRLGDIGFTIITGGGPGVMEAGNKGARQAGAASIGLNIELPEEQICNNYTTKSVTFDHFFVRKIMLVKYATAFVILPGGVGTMDELTEVLTLMQTRKIRPFPIVLYNSDFWQGFLDWMRHTVLGRGFISEEDLNLVRVCDEPQAVIDVVQTWYIRHEVVGRRALASG